MSPAGSIGYPQIGDKVKLCGLLKRPDLNGQIGVVTRAINSEGRAGVQITASDVACTEEKSIRCENLKNFSYAADWWFSPTSPAWKPEPLFSPIGYTPPRLLLENLPAHITKCDILLLGCEDSRHLLFTCSAMYKAGGLASKHSLDVTTSDRDCSTLARNILILKLILESPDRDLRMVWSIAYSPRIDDNCLLLLQSCAVQLLASATDLTAWHRTDFGKRIRFTDEDSFTEVVAIWRVYARECISESREADLEENRKNFMREGMQSGGTSSRNAVAPILTIGPAVSPFAVPRINRITSTSFIPDAASATGQVSILSSFVEDGRTPVCIYSPQATSLSDEAVWFLNPTLLQGAGQVPHRDYAIHPFHSFPIAQAFLTSDDPSEDDFYRCCFQEFSEWCVGFKSQFSRGLVTIRSYCGDALCLCEYLVRRQSGNTGRFIPSYSLKPMELLGDTPTSFDVVDSGYSVTNASGLLTILLVASPLLKRCLHSVLNTELRAIASEEEYLGKLFPNMTSLVEQQLLPCTDLTTMCSLLGLTTTSSALSHINLDYRLHLWQRARNKSGGGSGGKGGRSGGCPQIQWRLIPERRSYTMSTEDFIDLFLRIFDTNNFNAELSNPPNIRGAVNEREQGRKEDSSTRWEAGTYVKVIGYKGKDRQEQVQEAASGGRRKSPSTIPIGLLLCRFVSQCHPITDRHIDMLLKSLAHAGAGHHRSVGFDFCYMFERLGLFSGQTGPTEAWAEVLKNFTSDILSANKEGYLGLHFDDSSSSPVVRLTLLIPREEFEKEVWKYSPGFYIVIEGHIFTNCLRSSGCCQFHSIHQSYVRKCVLKSDPNYELLSAECDAHYPYASLATGSRTEHEFVALTTVVPWGVLIADSSIARPMGGVTVSVHLTRDSLRRCPESVILSASAQQGATDDDLVAYSVPLTRRDRVLLSLDMLPPPAPSIVSTHSPYCSSRSSSVAALATADPTVNEANTATVSPFEANLKVTATSAVITSFTSRVAFIDPTFAANMDSTIEVLPSTRRGDTSNAFGLKFTSRGHRVFVALSPPNPYDCVSRKLQNRINAIHVEVSKEKGPESVSNRPFPLLCTSDGLVSWGLPRVLLESLPAITIEDRATINPRSCVIASLRTLAAASIRAYASGVKEQDEHCMLAEDHENERRSKGFSYMKKTMYMMITAALGLAEPPYCPRWVALARMGGGHTGVRSFEDFELFVYMNAIRIDATLGSIVLDLVVCVVKDCASDTLNDIRQFLLPILQESGQCSLMEVEVEELAMWNSILPAACERVRNSWRHSEEHCEYRRVANVNGVSVPFSSMTLEQQDQKALDYRQRTVCSCGLGKELEGTDFLKRYGHAPAAKKCFVRAALSPMFPDDFTVQDTITSR